MKEKEEVVLICYEGAVPLAAGSTEHKCSVCGCRIWASPASLKLVQEKAREIGGQLILMCGHCVKPDAYEETNFAMALTPEQKAEMKEAGLDLDEIAARTGRSVSSLLRSAVKTWQTATALQHAAKRKEEKNGGDPNPGT
jgi:hypothetical protein